MSTGKTLQEYFETQSSIDHIVRHRVDLDGVTTFYIRPKDAEGDTLDFQVCGNELVLRNFKLPEKPSHKEQVIAGTINAQQAHAYGFEVVQAKDAVLDITITSKVRQIGRTSISHIVQKALVAAGYTNVNLDSRDTDMAERNGRKFPMFTENKDPGKTLKINVIDADPI